MIEYRWKKFPWYNKPVKSSNPKKKKMVLAKDWDKVKLIHFWDASMKDYTQHKDKERRKNYLARSWWIRNKQWELTKNDKLSPNYWARKTLW